MVVGHPDRHWRWRLRGSPVTLARAAGDAVAEHGHPDVVLVSGMTDLAALCGLSRGWLGATPVGLYLHESQLVHPAAPGETVPAEAVFANWRSMVVADRVFVNSAFHRDALFAALPAALADVPDLPHTDLLPEVAARTGVLPLGVELAGLLEGARAPDDGGPPLVVWPHRWDHDKRPEACCASSSPWRTPGWRSGWPSPGPTPGPTPASSPTRSGRSGPASSTWATCPAPGTRRCCAVPTWW